MGRLADCATALDIIARLHASLLLRSFLRMAAGELNKRGCCVNSISVHPRVFYWPCMWASRICMCRLFFSFFSLFCSSLPATGCGLFSANASICAGVHVRGGGGGGSGVLLAPPRCRVCVHACRMTFSKMWQRERKHLTHNWSAMKEIWSWIRIRLSCSALNERQEAGPRLRLPCHPEGWLQSTECYSAKMTEGNTVHLRRVILITKSIGRSVPISIKKGVLRQMYLCLCDSTTPVILMSRRVSSNAPHSPSHSWHVELCERQGERAAP